MLGAHGSPCPALATEVRKHRRCTILALPSRLLPWKNYSSWRARKAKASIPQPASPCHNLLVELSLVIRLSGRCCSSASVAFIAASHLILVVQLAVASIGEEAREGSEFTGETPVSVAVQRPVSSCAQLVDSAFKVKNILVVTVRGHLSRSQVASFVECLRDGTCCCFSSSISWRRCSRNCHFALRVMTFRGRCRVLGTLHTGARLGRLVPVHEQRSQIVRFSCHLTYTRNDH